MGKKPASSSSAKKKQTTTGSKKKKQPWRSSVPDSDDEDMRQAEEEAEAQEEEDQENEPGAFEVHKIINRRLIGSGDLPKKLSKAERASRLEAHRSAELAAAEAGLPPEEYEYEIWWKDFPRKEATWEPYSCLSACPGALRAFLHELKHKRPGDPTDADEMEMDEEVQAAAEEETGRAPDAAPSPARKKIRASITLKSHASPAARPAAVVADHRDDAMSDVDLTLEDAAATLSRTSLTTGAPSASTRRNELPQAPRPTETAAAAASNSQSAAAASTPVRAVASGAQPTTFKTVLGDPPAYAPPPPPYIAPAPPAAAPAPEPAAAAEAEAAAPTLAAAVRRDQHERKSQVRPSAEEIAARQQRETEKADRMEIDSQGDAPAAASAPASAHRPRRSAGDAAVHKIRNTVRGVTMLSSEGVAHPDFAIRDSMSAAEIERMFEQQEEEAAKAAAGGASAGAPSASSSHPSTPASSGHSKSPHQQPDEPEQKSATRPRPAANVVIELGDSSDEEARGSAAATATAAARSHKRRRSPSPMEVDPPADGARPRRIAAQQAGLLAKLSKDTAANMGDIRALLSEKVDRSLVQRSRTSAVAAAGPAAGGAAAGTSVPPAGDVLVARAASKARKSPSKHRPISADWAKRKARLAKQAADDADAAAAASGAAGPVYARHTKSDAELESALDDHAAAASAVADSHDDVGVDYISAQKRNPDYGRAKAVKALRESLDIYLIRWDDGSETWEPESILDAIPYARRDFKKRQAITQWRRDHLGEYEIGGEEEAAGREEFEFISRADEEFEYESEEEASQGEGAGAAGDRQQRVHPAEEEIDSALFRTLTHMVTPHDRERIEAEHLARDRLRRSEEKRQARAHKKSERRRQQESEADPVGFGPPAQHRLPPAPMAAIEIRTALATPSGRAGTPPMTTTTTTVRGRKRLPGVRDKSAATLADDALKAQNAALAAQYSQMYAHMQQANMISAEGVPLIPLPLAANASMMFAPPEATPAAAAASAASSVAPAAPPSFLTAGGPSMSALGPMALVLPPAPPATFYPLDPASASIATGATLAEAASHLPMLTPTEFQQMLAAYELQEDSVAKASEYAQRLAEEEYLLHQDDDDGADDDDEEWRDSKSSGRYGGESAGGPGGPPRKKKFRQRRTPWNPLDTPGLRGLPQLPFYWRRKCVAAKVAGQPMPHPKSGVVAPSIIEAIAAEWDTPKLATALLRERSLGAAPPAKRAATSKKVTVARTVVVPAAGGPAPLPAAATSPPKPPRPQSAFISSVLGQPAAFVPPLPAASPSAIPPGAAAAPLSLYPTSITPLARPVAPSSTPPAAAQISPEAMMDRALARMQTAMAAPTPTAAAPATAEATAVPTPSVPSADALQPAPQA